MQYELGIKFDEEAWYSVTPEAISEHQASRCATPRPSNENRLSLIFDAFCGVGGNSISFAKKGFFVIACDVDPTKVYKARENSKIYGVEQNIHFLCCDLFQYLPTFRPDVIFLSPPWGGPQYLHSLFNLESLVISGVNGLELVLQTLEITENVVYFLPRNTNIVPLYRIIKCPWEVRLLLST